MALAVCGLSLLCGQLHAEEDQVVAPSTGLEAALEAQRDAIMALPGVAGAGLSQCDGVPCIKVLAREASPRLEKELETLLSGHRYTIEQTGPIRAYPEDQ